MSLSTSKFREIFVIKAIPKKSEFKLLAEVTLVNVFMQSIFKIVKASKEDKYIRKSEPALFLDLLPAERMSLYHRTKNNLI
jgi:hypothetical protein